MLYSCEGCVLGCGAFVDGDEVLPVVEDVGANLLGGFQGGCAEDNYVVIVVSCFCFDRSSRRIPSVSAFSPSNLHFYISFRSFRPDFLSILNDRGAVPL